MPYILDERRQPVLDDPLNATEPGDLTFLFYFWMLVKWSKNPCWTTWHTIRKIIKDYSLDEEFHKLANYVNKSTHFKRLDITAAVEEAKDEFYRRVVTKYENGKKIANGDITIEKYQWKGVPR